MAGLVRKGDAPKTLFATNVEMLRSKPGVLLFLILVITCFFSFSFSLAVNTYTGSKLPR